MRVLVGLAVSVCLFVSAPPLTGSAGAGPLGAAAPGSTQSFTGGGHAYQGGGLVNYVSTGQLGSGLFFVPNLDLVRPTAKGPAHLVRPDGMTLTGTNQPSHSCGAIPSDTYCMSADLTGGDDVASAHIDFVVKPTLSTYPGKVGTVASADVLMRGVLVLRRRVGYAMVDARGAIYAFGGIDHLGNAPTSTATDLELTPSGNGYWVVNAAGQTYAFGDAPYLGNANPSTFAIGETVTSMSATPTARGYYMVGSDGGVFAFGDARFRGSTGNERLNRPVIGLVPTLGNKGYWLVASDGGVFSFGAPFLGSAPYYGYSPTQPMVAMARQGDTYLMVNRGGSVFNFDFGLFFGSKGDTRLAAPIVSAAAAG